MPRYAERMGRRYKSDDLSAVDPNREFGVYILTNGNNMVDYVGRSDTNLKRRLRGTIAAQPGCKYYWFSYETSMRNAYLKECRLYHKYRLDDPEIGYNQMHPGVPTDANWRCPNRNCHWH
jgi:hypothetical protein